VVHRKLVAGTLPPVPLTLVYRRDDPSALVRNFIAVAGSVLPERRWSLIALQIPVFLKRRRSINIKP
jgi:hypothetical protein